MGCPCYFGCGTKGNKCAWFFWCLLFLGGAGLLVAGGVHGYMQEDSLGLNTWESSKACLEAGTAPKDCFTQLKDDTDYTFLLDVALIIVGACLILPFSLIPCFYCCCCSKPENKVGFA